MLEFLDLVVLRVIMDVTATEKRRPRQWELWSADYSLVNDWLHEHGVLEYGRLYADPLNGNKRLNKSIARLREEGLLILPTRGKPSYAPTKRAKRFMQRMGHWTEWPSKLKRKYALTATS